MIIIVPENYPIQTSIHLQNHLYLMESWSFLWQTKINPEKSIHVNYTLKNAEYTPLHFQKTRIPISFKV
jgi:hypothetical protein